MKSNSESKREQSGSDELARFFELSLDMLGIADTNGYFKRVNPAFSNTLGWSSEEILARPFLDFVHPDDRAATERETQSLALGRPTLHFQNRYLCKDGSWKWIAWSTFAQSDGTLYATARDVTEIKEAADAVRRSEERLAITLDSIGDAVIATDSSRRITLLNVVAAQLTGWKAAEAIGRPIDEIFRIINEETGKPAVIPVDEVLATGNVHGLANHTALIARDGTICPIADSAAPIRDADGRIFGVVLVFRDVSAERRIEKMQMLAAIVESSDDAIISKSPDGIILTWNAGAERMFGYRADEVLGQPMLKLIPTGNPDEEHQLLELIRQGARVEHFETRRVRKDGTMVDVTVTLSPIKDAEGKIVGISSTMRDITDRKKAEEALIVAREAAESASRAKSEFLATMSHELRTPLNGIIGMNDLLLATELNEQQKKYAHACSSSGKLLLQLINDILDLSKIEAGKLEIDPRECDIEALVYDVADIMLPSAQKKNLALRCRLAPEACVIGVCDDNRVRQVLVNLIYNALKFTSVGSVTIDGTRVTHADGTERVRFAVRDTGVGIPAERHDRLFRAFSQVDSSTTRQFGGTGLGLSICRQLVELMGGEIGVESQVGVGSTFWFEIPLKIVSESHGWARKRQLLAGARLLVVDGLDKERSQIGDWLQSWGCPFEQVTACARALEAVNRAAEAGTPFKIVLVDNRLVLGDEYVVLQKLAAIPDLHVIALGAQLDDKSRNYLHALGVRHALPDPVRPSALLKAISSVLAVTGGTENSEVSHATNATHAAPLQKPAPLSGHVLVAEDNRINQIYIVDVLKDFGCTVDLVTNGEEVLTAVERQCYDLVLMDCQMPEMDGFAATREIRKREAAQQLPGRLPIVALTANALKGDRQRCLEAGMDDYLAKPVERGSMRSMLEKYLSQRADSQVSANPSGS